MQFFARCSPPIRRSCGDLSREKSRALTVRIVLGLLLSLLAVGEARAAAPFIDLGPSDNLALDQPRVAIEVFEDAAGTNSFGPEFQNTFLLDTGATGILAVDGSASELVTAGYETVGEFQEFLEKCKDLLMDQFGGYLEEKENDMYKSTMSKQQLDVYTDKDGQPGMFNKSTGEVIEETKVPTKERIGW